MPDHQVKVLVAKPGLDGHDVGAKVVVHALIDAGFDVVYTGLRQTPEAIVDSAIKQHADVIGLSVLSGAHLPLCRRVRDLMMEKGNIPEDDRMVLRQLGFRGVFPTGSHTGDIVSFIRENVK